MLIYFLIKKGETLYLFCYGEDMCLWNVSAAQRYSKMILRTVRYCDRRANYIFFEYRCAAEKNPQARVRTLKHNSRLFNL